MCVCCSCPLPCALSIPPAPSLALPACVLAVCLQLWRFEGSNTLAYYLRRRDTLRALARDLDVGEDIVVPVAMRQLLLGLAALHAAGLVHRCVCGGSEGGGWGQGAQSRRG